MRKESKAPPADRTVSATGVRPANISTQAVAAILENSSPLSRLTHDVGFHKEKITRISLAFGGTHLVTGSTDGMVRLWDISSGTCLRAFQDRDSTLSGILTAPGRARMITAAPFGGKKIWDLETGDCLASLRDQPGTPVCCDDVHFFCKQNWDVTPLFDKNRPRSKRSEALVYEIDSGKRVRAFEIEGVHIDSLAVSPDSKKIAVTSDDHYLRIWDLGSGELLHQLSPGRYFREIIGITPDSRYIVLSSALTIDVRDMETSATVFAMAIHPNNYQPRYFLQGSLLFEKRVDFASPGFLSTVRAIDIERGAISHIARFEGDIELKSITQGEGYCLGSRHGMIDIWDMRNREIIASEVLDPYDFDWNANLNAATPGKSQIAISREESVVRLIDPPSGQFTTFPAREPVRDVLITPDGKGLLTMGPSAVKHWDLAGGRHLREFSIPKTQLRGGLPQGAPQMAITPDGSRIVLPGKDGAILFDLSTGGKIREFPFELHAATERSDNQGAFALHVTPDGKRLMVVSGPGGFLGSYDILTGAPAAGFPLNDVGRFHAFCAGGDLFATSAGSILSLRDGQTGRPLRRYDQGDSIQSIAFLRSGTQMITTSVFRLSFRDQASGELTHEPDINTGLGYNRFGRWLCPVPGDRQLLVHHDNCVALWDMDRHRFLWQDSSWRKNRVRKAAVFPDGKRFVTVDATGMVEVRGIEKGGVLATLHVLPGGFIWETPPDTHAPSGWLWTDREDLVSVVARSRRGRSTKIFRKGDNEHASYLKIYNNRKMVMARIESTGAYRRQAGLYAAAMDKARIAGASGRSPAALPAGRKGDR
ncbi:MAG TPA: hypothetical protein PLR60_15440 [Syntrophorhabdaceae bacterium]|nr:hypothetical protein [Syntrophorhabdaceae bacterium]